MIPSISELHKILNIARILWQDIKLDMCEWGRIRGLSATEVDLLCVLGVSGRLTPLCLAQIMGKSKATILLTGRRLQESGLVEGAPDSRETTPFSFALTEKGVAIFNDLASINFMRSGRVTRALSILDRGEFEVFVRVGLKLLHALRGDRNYQWVQDSSENLKNLTLLDRKPVNEV